MDKQTIWNIIESYFKDNPTSLVDHHIDSYNNFIEVGISQIFKEKNPIRILKDQDPTTRQYKNIMNIFLGGRNGDKIYYGKPIIFDESREHYMFPNEARLRNMTYGFSMHYDVEIDFEIVKESGEVEKTSTTLEKIYMGKFPIMLRANNCVLNNLAREVRYSMGECRNDYGGYFLIDGKEKVIISQEKFADNMIYVKDKVNDLYSHSCEIRCVSEDASKPIRTLSVRIVTPTTTLKNNQIVVNVPNVRKPIPLFILMRALGIISDKQIIQTCLLDLERYKDYIDLFIPSIHDAGEIFNQQTAIKYMSTFTKGKSHAHIMEILMNYLLPNIGELNFRDKALYIGYMVKELLDVFIGNKKPTDRDNFKFKRVELPGSLLYDLFKEYYTLQQRDIFQKIDKEYYYKKSIYENNFPALILNNFNEFFANKIVEEGFRKAFKGNWGSDENSKRLGIVQDINRLSYNSAISLLRKINLPLDASAKVVGPRLLHSSQWGIIDPVDTPDGGNIGLHKHMSILAKITKMCSQKSIIDWIKLNTNIKILNECDYGTLSTKTKVFVNGTWIGVVSDPIEVKNLLINARRNAIINIFTSISWEIQSNIIFIFTDSGRMSHPVFYIDKEINKVSIDNAEILDLINQKKFNWIDLITGFNKKSDKFNINNCETFLKVNDLYPGKKLEQLKDKQAVLEYIDSAEEDTALISISFDDLDKKPYSHVEIHPSLILGVMGNQIVFPENNQLPRDLFSCGQSKQAISVYHSNFTSRFDKTSYILNYGQVPLIKSRYLKLIHNEEHPYGANVIVAIGCYGSYNVEDSILFNKASLDRGMFRNTYYNTYEAREESSKVGNSSIDSRFTNIENENVIGLKVGYDYSNLNKFGVIKENTPIDEKTILIGKTLTNLSNPSVSLDSSVSPKKGALGYVDKSFITDGEEGFRIAKIRIRDERIPAIGDKFCSRCGQKGTIGLVIEEDNMPYTAEGIKPDIIINPHAIPSRMTIGQLLETVMGKACCELGSYAECTAFNNDGPKYKSFGKILQNFGYSSSANEILYNGETGEQLHMDLFIGPTYYMRLKHVVKDKINYRARGPRTVLTRQTVQGRANDGGLRVGEQERDSILAHGLSYFLQESMLLRGDEYFCAVCNLTGMIAVYNPSLNLFLSPFADGPLQYSGLDVKDPRIENISKFGRSFSIVRIPYAFKLLIQELITLGVTIRIVTDENIDQLTSMSFGGTIKNITSIEKLSFEKSVSSIDDLKKSIEPLTKPEESIIPEAKSIQISPSDKLSTEDSEISEDALLKELELLEEQEDDVSEQLNSVEKSLSALEGVKELDLSVPLIGKKNIKNTGETGDDIEEKSKEHEELAADLEEVDIVPDGEIKEEELEITTPIDDPSTPDTLEKKTLNILTDIVDLEDKSSDDKESEKDKSVVI